MYGATGATYSVCGVRRDQQLCLLCGVACATLVVRALVTLPLQAWSHLLFFVIMAANGATMYFFTLFVLRPSSFVASFVVHRPIFWGAYLSSSVLYLTTTVCKQRAANCEGHQRDPEGRL